VYSKPEDLLFCVGLKEMKKHLFIFESLIIKNASEVRFWGISS
jgi:hypothetical protein